LHLHSASFVEDLVQGLPADEIVLNLIELAVLEDEVLPLVTLHELSKSIEVEVFVYLKRHFLVVETGRQLREKKCE